MAKVAKAKAVTTLLSILRILVVIVECLFEVGQEQLMRLRPRLKRHGKKKKRRRCSQPAASLFLYCSLGADPWLGSCGASGELRAAVHRDSGNGLLLAKRQRGEARINDADPSLVDSWLVSPTWMQIFHEAGVDGGASWVAIRVLEAPLS